jgi:DNA-binding MarR family transcriptional regulator
MDDLPPSVDAKLSEFPPSVTFVFRIVWATAPATADEIAECGLLADRTTRRALDHLEAADLIVSEPVPEDPRTTQFRPADL